MAAADDHQVETGAAFTFRPVGFLRHRLVLEGNSRLHELHQKSVRVSRGILQSRLGLLRDVYFTLSPDGEIVCVLEEIVGTWQPVQTVTLLYHGSDFRNAARAMNNALSAGERAGYRAFRPEDLSARFYDVSIATAIEKLEESWEGAAPFPGSALLAAR